MSERRQWQVVIGTRVPPEVSAAIRKAARENGITVSELARDAIGAWLELHKQEEQTDVDG